MAIPGCRPFGSTGPYALPPGLRVYAVGDVHGRADLLDGVLARIDAHRAAHSAPASREVFLGDLIDRGPDSRAVIDTLMARQGAGAATILSGNHEDMMLQVIRQPDLLSQWGRNGGYQTLASFGLRHRGDKGERIPPPVIRDALVEALGPERLAFLSGLPASLAVGGLLFVHAGIRPGVAPDAQARPDLLWIREEFHRHAGDLGAFVVHGHTPVAQAEAWPNRANIDTGAYVTNRLTCLVAEGSTLGLLDS